MLFFVSLIRSLLYKKNRGTIVPLWKYESFISVSITEHLVTPCSSMRLEKPDFLSHQIPYGKLATC